MVLFEIVPKIVLFSDNFKTFFSKISVRRITFKANFEISFESYSKILSIINRIFFKFEYFVISG